MAEDRGIQLLVANIAFLTIAACTVLMRSYTRAVLSKAFGLDDWLMVISAVLFLGYVICSNIGVHYGTGQHRSDLSEYNYQRAKMFWWLCYISFGMTMLTAKLSFGCLLLRIVCNPIHSFIVYGASMIIIVSGIVFIIITILQCQPIWKYWREDVPGFCIPLHIIVGLGYLYSAASVGTDLIFALLPAFVIWHLQLERRIRFILIVLVAMGCVASCAVLVRIAYVKTLLDPDFLYNTTNIAMWSTIEMGLAISAASIATLRPLARYLGWKVSFTANTSRPGDELGNRRWHYGRSEVNTASTCRQPRSREITDEAVEESGHAGDPLEFIGPN